MGLKPLLVALVLVLFIVFPHAGFSLETSCSGGAGGSLSAGINTGSYPEYYRIYNYGNNVNCGQSAAYSCPAGSTAKIYLWYDTEAGYDKVKVYNGAGTLLGDISGSSGFDYDPILGENVPRFAWKGPYSSNSLKFGFTSDVDTTKIGFGIWQIECIQPSSPPACSAPGIPADASTRCQSVGSDRISFGWNAVAGASNYKLQYKKSSDSSYSNSVDTTGTGALQQVTGLAASTPYDFQVQVRTSDGTCVAPSAWSATGSCTTSAPPDTTAPSAGSISVNSGATYTTSTSVTLTLSCTDNVGCTNMMISNDAAFSGASWETYSTSKSWTLSSGDGLKIVYVKFKDAASNVGSTYSDGITLDTANPSISSFSSTPASPIAQGNSITFGITASDNIGLSKVQVYNPDTSARVDSTSCSGSTSCTRSIVVTPSSTGSKTYTAYAVDLAGREFAYDTTITYNVLLPAPALSLPADSAVVTLPVTLSWNSVTGANSYYYSVNLGSTQKSYGCTGTLTSVSVDAPALATNNIYTWYVLANKGANCGGAYGQQSSSRTFTINAPPSISSFTLDKNTPIALGNSVTLTTTATDDNGVAKIYFYDPDNTNTAGDPEATDIANWHMQTCSGSPTSCTKTRAANPAAGDKTYLTIAKDTNGAMVSATKPMTIVNSCANWVCPALSTGDKTTGLPAISSAQYVNYADCTATCTCPAGYKIEVTASGNTEADRDYFSLVGDCAGRYGPDSGTFNYLYNACGTQSAGLRFTSDYSVNGLNGYTGVSATKISCIVSDTTPPTITASSPSFFVSNPVIMAVTTDEASDCRYSTTAGTAYGSMTGAFTTTDGLYHSASLGTMAIGAKNYYVRCQDRSSAQNKMASDHAVSFSVLDPPTLDYPSNGAVITYLMPMLDWTASEGANCYTVQIWDGTTLLTNTYYNEVPAEWPSTTSYSVPGGKLAYQKTYAWKVFPSADSCQHFASPAIATFSTRFPTPCSDKNAPCSLSCGGAGTPSGIFGNPDTMTYTGESGYWKFVLPSNGDIVISTNPLSSLDSQLRVGTGPNWIDVCSGTGSGAGVGDYCSKNGLAAGTYYVTIANQNPPNNPGLDYPSLQCVVCPQATPVTGTNSWGVTGDCWKYKRVCTESGTQCHLSCGGTMDTQAKGSSPTTSSRSFTIPKGMWDVTATMNNIDSYVECHGVNAGCGNPGDECISKIADVYLQVYLDGVLVREGSTSAAALAQTALGGPHGTVKARGTGSTVTVSYNGMTCGKDAGCQLRLDRSYGYNGRAYRFSWPGGGGDYYASQATSDLSVAWTGSCSSDADCKAVDTSKPYCDPTLRKCYGCSIANNDPSNTDDKPNLGDCGYNAQNIIGKCKLVSDPVLGTASKGGACRFETGCAQSNECVSACCSAVSPTSGPGTGSACITPASAGNPINPYLCKQT